jgi:hypothetical protein
LRVEPEVILESSHASVRIENQNDVDQPARLFTREMFRCGLERFGQILRALFELGPAYGISQTGTHRGRQCWFDSLTALKGYGNNVGEVIRRFHRSELRKVEGTLAVRIFVQRGDELPLCREIPVDRWNGYPGLACDKWNRQFRDAVLRHHFHQTIQNPLACLNCALFT